MKQKGMFIECDADDCRNSTFCKHIGTGETDGGYTRWDNFEEPPKGWQNVSCQGSSSVYHHLMLCPVCSDKYFRGLEELLYSISKETAAACCPRTVGKS